MGSLQRVAGALQTESLPAALGRPSAACARPARPLAAVTHARGADERKKALREILKLVRSAIGGERRETASRSAEELLRTDTSASTSVLSFASFGGDWNTVVRRSATSCVFTQGRRPIALRLPATLWRRTRPLEPESLLGRKTRVVAAEGAICLVRLSCRECVTRTVRPCGYGLATGGRPAVGVLPSDGP